VLSFDCFGNIGSFEQLIRYIKPLFLLPSGNHKTDAKYNVMKTIVVAVDFSTSSNHSIDYALAFAKATGSSLTLVHIYQLPLNLGEVLPSPEVITELMDDAEENMRVLKDSVLQKAMGKIKIYTDLLEGNVIIQLEKFCNNIQPYAIVMGAHSASTLNRVLFGSNVLQALRKMSWPLIIVPPDAVFRKISKICLACDLIDVTENIHAETIKNLVAALGAELHILYVNTYNRKKISSEEREQSELLKEMFAGIKCHFHFLSNELVEEEISEWIEKNKPDVLMVVPKKHDLLYRITYKSQSKQMVLHAHLPVIAIHE
jgi:nucleotide-binding universal stress UspA family protein